MNKLAVVFFILSLAVMGCARTAPQEQVPTTKPMPAMDHGDVDEMEDLHEGMNHEMEIFVQDVTVHVSQFKFTPDPIIVSKGNKVRVHLWSDDVAHGFSVPDLNIISGEVPPGKEVIVEFMADKSGEYMIKCSVYCGNGHKDMKGTLIIEE